MGKIHVLDDNMINMIAAGEVVERPASVVKELLENSIDAGATRIVVKIEDGGRKLVSITDNGCGIDAGDIPTAFAPHATSKLRTDADLGTISTMGFRGEALASIASVSGVTITSRTEDSIQANRLEIDCGDFTDTIVAAPDHGYIKIDGLEGLAELALIRRAANGEVLATWTEDGSEIKITN